MKNSLTLVVTLALLLSAGLGCGLAGRAKRSASGSERTSSTDDNKTLTDKGIDIAMGDEKIGIPECDEVIDFFNREIDDPNDDFVTKAVKKTALNKFKEKFKESLKESNTNKVEMAKTCREFKRNLDLYKNESPERAN